MRNSRRIAFFVATTFIVVLGGSVFAQQAGQPAPQQGGQVSPRIGVVDFVEILKAHPKYNKEAKDIQGQIQQLQAQFVDQQKQLQNKSNILNTFKVGSKEFMDANDAISQEAAQSESEANKAMRNIRLTGFKQQYDAYKSIREEVAESAKELGIVAVIDIRSLEDNTDDLGAIEMSMSQPVIWYHQNVDLTNKVITRLNTRFNQYPVVVTIDANGKRITNPQTSAVVSAQQQQSRMGAPTGMGQGQLQQPQLQQQPQQQQPGTAGTRPGPAQR
ncbi:MAG: OmpH family outer membrane protein [Thermoguttaceae bacterium]